MSNFGSIGEFRAALNGLVASTNPRRGRARKNMAIRRLPGGGIEADTPEELIAYERAMAGAPPVAAAPIAAGRAAARAPRAAPRRQREFTVREPEALIDSKSYKIAKAIGVSVGGLGSVCPELIGQQVPGGAYVEALRRMGLTKGRASAVIDAMGAEGVLFWFSAKEAGNTPATQARARQILAEVGGVTCPVPGRGNPRRSRARRNASGDIFVFRDLTEDDLWDLAEQGGRNAEGAVDELKKRGWSDAEIRKELRDWAPQSYYEEMRAQAGEDPHENPRRPRKKALSTMAEFNALALVNMAGRPRALGLPAAPLGVPAYAKKGRKELEALAGAGDQAAAAELSRREASREMRVGIEHPERVAKRPKFKKDDVVLAFGRAPGSVIQKLPRDKTGIQWYLVDLGPAGHQPVAEAHLSVGPAQLRAAGNPYGWR